MSGLLHHATAHFIFLKRLNFFEFLEKDKQVEILAKSFFEALHPLTKIFFGQTYNQMHSPNEAVA